MRKIGQFQVMGSAFVVKAYKDTDTGEYVCKLYENNVHYEPADYFTDDKQDALDTAELMALRNPV